MRRVLRQPETARNREVAEGVGFEPTIRLPVYTLSRRAPSTARPPLLAAQGYRSGPKLSNLAFIFGIEGGIVRGFAAHPSLMLGTAVAKTLRRPAPPAAAGRTHEHG